MHCGSQDSRRKRNTTDIISAERLRNKITTLGFATKMIFFLMLLCTRGEKWPKVITVEIRETKRKSIC